MPEGEPNPYIRQSVEERPGGGEMPEEEKHSPYIKQTEESEPTAKTELQQTAKKYRERLVAALQHQFVDTCRNLFSELQELAERIGRERWENEVAPAIKGEIPLSSNGVTFLSTENNTKTFADAFIEHLSEADFHGANIMLENFARAVEVLEKRKKSPQ